MTDLRCWILIYTIFILQVLVVNSQNEVDSSQFLEVFADSFLTSEDDFIDPAPQDDLFPFEKAKNKNLKIDKKYAEKINDDVRAANLTEKLKLWKGFKELSQQTNDTSLDFIEEFDSFSSNTRNHFLDSNTKLEDGEVLELSLAWLNLLQSSKIDISISIDDLIDMYQDSPTNTALLYKIATLLRDGPENETIFRLWNGVNFPRYLESSVGYMVGYRWKIDSNTRISLKTLMTLPSDVIVSMNEETFDGLKMDQLLTDSEVFLSSSQEKQVAWFNKFIEEEGWIDVAGNAENLKRHGHLMAGASLEYLQKLELDDVHGKTDLDLLFQVLKNNSFSSSRVRYCPQ